MGDAQIPLGDDHRRGYGVPPEADGNDRVERGVPRHDESVENRKGDLLLVTFLLFVGDSFFVGIGDKGEGAVTGDVAGGAKAILKSKNRQEKGRTGLVEMQNRDNQTERCKYRSARDTRGADSK